MTDPRTLILEHLLPLVPFDGWSETSLAHAAKKAALDGTKIFPGGVVEAVDYFFTSEDEVLTQNFTEKQLAEMRVPQRIESLILARLRHLAPNREAVRRALAFYALPWNAPHGLKALYRTVDIIWRLAGDQSLDFNFYTKRATLAGVYSATTAFWLNDNSENFIETTEFMKRRLANVAAFGKWKKDLTSKFRRA